MIRQRDQKLQKSLVEESPQHNYEIRSGATPQSCSDMNSPEVV